MSFILDALKKSELERQRQAVPGLMDPRLNSRRNRLPIWALALGVNLLVLTLVLMHRSAPAVHSARPAASQDMHAGATPAVPPHFSPLDNAPVYAPEIPVASEQSPASRPAPARASSPGIAAGPAAHAPHRPDPLLTEAEPGENQEVLPTISEMNLSGTQALPELHLDVHVYATKAADRFIYVNMRKYHEGAVLQEGPMVERIRRDGVVLNYQGLRFILPRQP